MAARPAGASSVDPRIDPWGFFGHGMAAAATGVPDPGAIAPRAQPAGQPTAVQRSVQQAAEREDVSKWGVTEVQLPSGKWGYRLQNPDDPNDLRMFGYGREGDRIGRERYEKNTGMPVSRADEFQLNKEKKEEERQKAAMQRLDVNDKRDYLLRKATSDAQISAANAQIVQGQAQTQLARETFIENTRRYGLEAAERAERNRVLDERYTDELRRNNNILMYNSQVRGWEARNQASTDKFRLIGMALQGLMA